MGSCSSKQISSSMAVVERVLELVRQLIDEGDLDKAKKIMKLNNISKEKQNEILHRSVNAKSHT